MEKYLQILVITLPAVAIAVGGLLLIVFMCLRSWNKGPSKDPIRLCSVNTQFDGSLQVTQEIRDKLVEEAMARVKFYLSEEFRKKQASKISQEEFNKLYAKQRGVDFESSTESSTDENRKRQEIMESVCRIPGIAPLSYAVKTQDSAPLKKTDSFATLWVEELQRSGDAKPAVTDTKPREREKPKPGTEPPILMQSMVASGDGSATRVDSAPADQGCGDAELGLSKGATMKSWNELKLLNDLEMFLLTASSNMCRSIMAFSMDYKPGAGLTLSTSKEICMMPGRDLELGSTELASVASTSALQVNNAPQLLKGGAPNDNFVWRLDIDEKDVDPSPPNTPVRRRAPSHLCTGVQFQVAEHPPALSIIDLDPELGYGWRGPEWKETFGKHHIYNEREGPSIYRKKKSTNDNCVAGYYKSVEAEAKKRWEKVQDRYRRAQKLAAIKVQIREDIRLSAEWRKHLQDSFYSDTDSSMDSEDVEATAEQGEKNGNKDENRVRSMLSTSSSSTLDSDDAIKPVIENQMQCLRKHRHCKLEIPTTSTRKY